MAKIKCQHRAFPLKLGLLCLIGNVRELIVETLDLLVYAAPLRSLMDWRRSPKPVVLNLGHPIIARQVVTQITKQIWRYIIPLSVGLFIYYMLSFLSRAHGADFLNGLVTSSGNSAHVSRSFQSVNDSSHHRSGGRTSPTKLNLPILLFLKSYFSRFVRSYLFFFPC